MLTDEQAAELFREYKKTGDVATRNRLVENYLYIAQILAGKFRNRGVEYDDLYQIAAGALIEGVEKFDPDMGNKFTTYITPTITGIIRNYFRDYARSIRIPRRVYALAGRVHSAINKYYLENGAKPTVRQLAAILGEPEEEIIEAMECHTPVSLDSTIKSEDSEVPLYEIIPDEDNAFERFEESETLKAEIAKLDDVEKRVVELRFVQGKSQTEAGKILGVSQMFISRAERRIVEKLKEALKK